MQLLYRAPLTGLGATLLSTLYLLDTEYIGGRAWKTDDAVENFTGKFARNYPLKYGSVLWAVLGVFPYALVPSLLFPGFELTFVAISDPYGDRFYEKWNRKQ